jgi:hypothetical protein
MLKVQKDLAIWEKIRTFVVGEQRRRQLRQSLLFRQHKQKKNVQLSQATRFNCLIINK